MDSWIYHIDMNAFYASVECQRNPALRPFPVAVTGDPEARHGIILTANYNAKRMGVKTAEAIWEAKQKCPGLICVGANYEQYEKYSAHAAVKSKATPYYRVKYERISKRRGKKRAIIAISRMILIAIFRMLSTGEVWNPCDPKKLDMPEALREKQLQADLKRAAKLLIKHGAVPEDSVSLPLASSA